MKRARPIYDGRGKDTWSGSVAWSNWLRREGCAVLLGRYCYAGVAADRQDLKEEPPASTPRTTGSGSTTSTEDQVTLLNHRQRTVIAD